MSAVTTFCKTHAIAHEWFAIVVRLVGQRGFSTPIQLSKAMLGECDGCFYQFLPEHVAISAASETDWLSVIDEMAASGFVVIARNEDVAAMVHRYRCEPSANTLFAEPYVGCVMLTDKGYQFWSEIRVSPIMAGVPRWRYTIDRNDCYMYIAPTREELEKLCPLLGFDEMQDESLHGCCSRFDVGEENTRCQIEHIGPYWDDNYFRYPDGFAIRCLKTRADDDDPHRGILNCSDIT